MERCGWSDEHQKQLSGIGEEIERHTLIDFMQQLCDCARTVPPDRLARTTIEVLTLLDDGKPIGEITVDQVKQLLEANIV
jgi:hypothetical protein